MADDPNQIELLRLAREVQQRAYVPYSNYPVGAALMAESGAIYLGCNVENAAYPEGTCAEAGAVAAMVAGGDTRIAAIVVTTNGELLGTPCGGCRQKIREFASADTVIHVAGSSGIAKSYTIGELLPDGFGPDHLEP